MISCLPPTVPVIGFAQSFVDSKRLSGAKITWLETQQSLQTDGSGQFQFCSLPNQKVTLLLTFDGYTSLQTNTVTVPISGLQTLFNEMTFQVPRIATYDSLKYLLTTERDTTLNPDDCQVVTTITQYHKTLHDDPQGIAGATVVLTQSGQPVTLSVKPFYFGIFANGKTDPFSGDLTTTSLDGGVALLNVAPSDLPYTITAKKMGVHFTQAQFLCRKGQLINISPPQGPSQIEPNS